MSHEIAVTTHPGRAPQQIGRCEECGAWLALAHQPGCSAALAVRTRSYVSCSCGWTGPQQYDSEADALEVGMAHRAGRVEEEVRLPWLAPEEAVEAGRREGVRVVHLGEERFLLEGLRGYVATFKRHVGVS